MFINTGCSNLLNKSGDITNLNNVDYYKRYIIIELPKNIFEKTEITIINISSTTGKSFLGLLSKNERNQNNYLYHAHGKNILNFIPNILSKDIVKSCINFESMIMIDEFSYGNHNYNISKQLYNELNTTSSYNDMFHDIHNDNLILECMPYPKFYNYEHHLLNEEINETSIPFGNNLVYQNLLIKLKDLIDNHTFIYIMRNSDYSNISNKMSETSINLPFEDLSKLLIGPVTNLAISLMVNELDFCYDSDLYPKFSRIKYKTDHKEPKNLYISQIQSNLLTQFEHDIEYLREIMNCSFRLFIHFTIGNLKLKFIKYEKNFGNVHYDFSYDIGNCRNEQHQNTLEFVNSILF